MSIPRRPHRERLRRALASSALGAESAPDAAAESAPESAPERRVVIDIASRRDTIERIETERLAYPLPRRLSLSLSSLSLSSLSLSSRSLARPLLAVVWVLIPPITTPHTPPLS